MREREGGLELLLVSWGVSDFYTWKKYFFVNFFMTLSVKYWRKRCIQNWNFKQKESKNSEKKKVKGEKITRGEPVGYRQCSVPWIPDIKSVFITDFTNAHTPSGQTAFDRLSFSLLSSLPFPRPFLYGFFF